MNNQENIIKSIAEVSCHYKCLKCDKLNTDKCASESCFKGFIDLSKEIYTKIVMPILSVHKKQMEEIFDTFCPDWRIELEARRIAKKWMKEAGLL